MDSKLALAVTPWSVGDSWTASSLCGQAEQAEAMGFHSIWLPENHFGDNRSLPSPLTLLAAIAGRTTTLKLGTTSYLLPIRNPLQAAEEVAVLDQLSEGRLILGIGRGVQEAMFKAFDFPVKEKRKVFKANLDIMQRAWRGESIGGDDIFLAPLPYQKPHPPLWIAAFGPLALKQAGSLGMPYLASPMESLETLVANYQRHHQFAVEAGFEKIETVPVMRTVFVTRSKSQETQLMASLKALGEQRTRGQDDDIKDWAIIGSAAQVADEVAEYREALGMSHLIVRGRLPGIEADEQLASHEALIQVLS